MAIYLVTSHKKGIALNTIGVSDVQVQTMSNGRQKLMVNFCGTVFQSVTNGIPQNVNGVMADVSIKAAVSIAADKASDILSNLSNGKITTSSAVLQLKSAGLAVT